MEEAQKPFVERTCDPGFAARARFRGRFLGVGFKTLLASLAVPALLSLPFHGALSSIGSIGQEHEAAWFLDNIANMRDSVQRATLEGRRQFTLASGQTVTLTIDPALQHEVTQTLADQKPDVGAFMAIEPKTGRVLALSGYRSGIGGDLEPALSSDYPAASLVKIVTASAAIETLDFTPLTRICYRTGVLSLTLKDIQAPETDRYPSMTLSEAMAKSANSVFGKLAASYLGQETLKKYLDGYFFDQPIPFDLAEITSATVIPSEGLELAMAGAGFGNVTLSPVHAAMVGASLANGGVMMRPFLIDSIRDAGGDLLFSAKEWVIANPVSALTAAEVIGMMRETPVSGTLRKTFPGGKWASFAKKNDIAGKTGTLSWGTPKLYYRWILGIAPADNPTICIAALTGNNQPRLSKSSYLAREALAEFFDFEEGFAPAPKRPVAKPVPSSQKKTKRSRS